jgi:tripartite-type tricarboxylate transporter receptor subunit TctC
VLAPAKTPDAPAEAVRSGLKQAVSDQALRARLTELGVDPVWDEAATVSNAIAADLMRWGQLARLAKIEAPQ